MSSKQIATSTLWQIGSQVTMAALSIVSVKMIAIGLNKELAGTYNSAYGFLQLFGIFADFGLYAVAVRELSKSRQRVQVLASLIAVRLLILVFSLSVALGIAWSVPAWQNTPLPLAITIAAAVPFFTLIAGILRSIFQVHFKMHYIFIAEVLQRIVSTGALLLWVAGGISDSQNPIDMYWFLSAGGAGAALLLVVSVYFSRQLMPLQISFDSKRMLTMFKKAAPYGIAFFCMALYRQLDTTLIALLHPNFEVENAYYGFVLRMVEMGYIIPTFLLNSTLPVLSERYENGTPVGQLLGKTLLILLTIGSISFLFSLIWARPLVQLLTTSSYLATPGRPGSDTALMLMSVPIFLNSLIVYGFYVLLTINKWPQLIRTLLFGAVISVGLNIYLIPTHGFVGVGITSIIVHILIAIGLCKDSFTLLPPVIPKRWLRQWGMFTLGLTVFLLITRPLLVSELFTVAWLLVSALVLGILLYMSGIVRSLR